MSGTAASPELPFESEEPDPPSGAGPAGGVGGAGGAGVTDGVGLAGGAGGVRFLHSADWQLGMVRHFLGPEAQARYTQARIDAIESVARLAEREGAAFVVVAGDVFDANQVDRQIVLRACEALRTMPCPAYLLPGNHDSLEPGSVWSGPPLTSHLPEGVEVLVDGEPRCPVPGVEVVGVPWRTKRMLGDPLEPIADLPPVADGVVRVVVGHGQVDALVPDVGDPGLIRLAAVERAVEEGRAQFVALGDRHSVTSVGRTGRIWYAGTTEPTRPEEDAPGHVLRVDLEPAGTAEPGRCEVTPLSIGTWRLLSYVAEVDSDEALDALADRLASEPDKARTVLRLGVRGSLSVAGFGRLEMLLEAQQEMYAAIQRWRRHWDVGLRPDDRDLDLLDVSGPARGALEELRAACGDGDAEAADALALLHRLTSVGRVS